MNKLLKFRNADADSFIKEIKGKRVCHVIRRRLTKKLTLTDTSVVYLQWLGNTEDEFFIATFYGGLLTMSVGEREMFLGSVVNVVAISKHLEPFNQSKLNINNEQEFADRIKLEAEYLKNHYADDLENLRFKHLMSIIKWKFASRKIKEDEFCMEH